MAKENKVKFPSLIYLLGFMGSGKSTVGAYLAEQLKYGFIDLDDFITKTESKSISEIFNDHGEEYFRELESKALGYTSKLSHMIVSLGGGTPVFNDNMNIINATGLSIWLYVSPQETFDRIVNSTTRPLLTPMSKEEKMIFITEKMEAREGYYSQADLIVNGELKKEEVSLQIINKLKEII